MIGLISDPSVVGEQLNGRAASLIAWLTSILLKLLSIITVVTAVW